MSRRYYGVPLLGHLVFRDRRISRAIAPPVYRAVVANQNTPCAANCAASGPVYPPGTDSGHPALPGDPAALAFRMRSSTPKERSALKPSQHRR